MSGAAATSPSHRRTAGSDPAERRGDGANGQVELRRDWLPLDDKQGDVIRGLGIADQRAHHPRGHGLRTAAADRRPQPLEAVVDHLAATLDETVGVETQQRAGLTRSRWHGEDRPRPLQSACQGECRGVPSFRPGCAGQAVGGRRSKCATGGERDPSHRTGPSPSRRARSGQTLRSRRVEHVGGIGAVERVGAQRATQAAHDDSGPDAPPDDIADDDADLTRGQR